MTNLRTAIGLMSGTSIDGIDVAMIRTDGVDRVEHLAAGSYPYRPDERQLLRRAMARAADLSDKTARPHPLDEAEALVTERHVEAVLAFLGANQAPEVDLIGFHGQTVLHAPDVGLTVQIGNGRQLADRTGIPVIFDMRAADMAAGGEGAPLAPAYHRALAAALPEIPAVFVNIGGVANVTWISGSGDLLAFDTGPGNALMDDWTMQHTGSPIDQDGRLARAGTCNQAALHELLRNDYFDRPVPKSLDRDDFSTAPVEGMSTQDGLATLAHFTASSITRSAAWFPEQPKLWVISGGGRHNSFLMETLAWYAEVPVVPAEAIGCNGDAIEAEAWAYLAVRSVDGLPLTFPGTTGVPQPVSGGVRCDPGVG